MRTIFNPGGSINPVVFSQIQIKAVWRFLWPYLDVQSGSSKHPTELWRRRSREDLWTPQICGGIMEELLLMGLMGIWRTERWDGRGLQPQSSNLNRVVYADVSVVQPWPRLELERGDLPGVCTSETTWPGWIWPPVPTGSSWIRPGWIITRVTDCSTCCRPAADPGLPCSDSSSRS